MERSFRYSTGVAAVPAEPLRPPCRPPESPPPPPTASRPPAAASEPESTSYWCRPTGSRASLAERSPQEELEERKRSRRERCPASNRAPSGSPAEWMTAPWERAAAIPWALPRGTAWDLPTTREDSRPPAISRATCRRARIVPEASLRRQRVRGKADCSSPVLASTCSLARHLSSAEDRVTDRPAAAGLRSLWHRPLFGPFGLRHFGGGADRSAVRRTAPPVLAAHSRLWLWRPPAWDRQARDRRLPAAWRGQLGGRHGLRGRIIGRLGVLAERFG